MWLLYIERTFIMIDDPQNHDALQLLAANLRRLRIARHLSLSELARDTGMSKATLSGIENGRANPTVQTLTSLAQALGVSVAELLDEPLLGEVRISRASSARFIEQDGLRRRPLESIAPAGTTEIAEIAFAPHQQLELPPRPPGTRGRVFVLAGQLTAGPVERISELAAGDYMAFPADVPHLLAAGARAARALLFSSAPT
jgi:transcriptional regulator with XRE-family HTH domain